MYALELGLAMGQSTVSRSEWDMKQSIPLPLIVVRYNAVEFITLAMRTSRLVGFYDTLGIV